MPFSAALTTYWSRNRKASSPIVARQMSAIRSLNTKSCSDALFSSAKKGQEVAAAFVVDAQVGRRPAASISASISSMNLPALVTQGGEMLAAG